MLSLLFLSMISNVFSFRYFFFIFSLQFDTLLSEWNHCIQWFHGYQNIDSDQSRYNLDLVTVQTHAQAQANSLNFLDDWCVLLSIIFLPFFALFLVQMASAFAHIWFMQIRKIQSIIPFLKKCTQNIWIVVNINQYRKHIR